MAFGGDATRSPCPPARARAAGFTLLVVSFVLFVAAIVGAFALPHWQASQRVSRARTTVTALKHFVRAFQQYANDHGDWPAAVNAPGAYPAGMDAALGAAWQEPTPIGGHYVWLIQTVQRGERVRAAIAIVSAGGSAASSDQRQLEEFVRQAKAGGIETHRLRLGYRDQPVYILEH